MKTMIALLRGINVGGRNALPMKSLTSVLEDQGCRNVRTYIQSGNAVFEHEGVDAEQLATSIGAEILDRHGFEPRILILERRELERVIAGNPFSEAKPDSKSVHVGFLSDVPDDPDLESLEGLRRKSERFRLTGSVFYLHAPDGIGRSKLAASAERHLGVPMTLRNGRTVSMIQEMAKDRD